MFGESLKLLPASRLALTKDIHGPSWQHKPARCNDRLVLPAAESVDLAAVAMLGLLTDCLQLGATMLLAPGL